MEFESIRDIEAKKEALKEARNQILEKAKLKYEREEKKRVESAARGEDKWMLPSLSEKIDKHTQELKEKKLKLKKEKKERKERKKKDKKKKKSKHDSDSGDEWVEVTKTKTVKPSEQTEKETTPDGVNTESQTEPQTDDSGNLRRDDWMMMDADLPTVSRDELREKIRQDKAHYASLAKHVEPVLDEPGQHANELNPYWKSGSGTGLPSEQLADKTSCKPKFSLKYLNESYERMEKECEETGTSMEHLAEGRFGSLEKLEMMIMESERAEELKIEQEKSKAESRKFVRPDDSEHMTRRHHDRPRSRERSSRNTRDRSRSRENERSHRGRRRSRSRSRERRNRSRSRDRKRSRDRRHGSRDRQTRSRNRKSRSRSRSRNRRSNSKSKERRSHSPVKKRMFMKPGEMAERSLKSEMKTSSRPNWKKPSEDAQSAVGPQPENRVKKVEPEVKKTVERLPSPESSSTESSSEDEEPVQQPIKMLTEAEMNSLGAKILRAEMMGNSEAANRLKSELESARGAQKNAAIQPQRAADQQDKERVLVLTRTDRHGNSIPLTPSELRTSHKSNTRKEKRKDKKPVNTRDEKGEITKYFIDDDRFSISDMVRSEKLTTAADQQQLFSKLASKVSEKTNDDDRTLDDVMTEKAAGKNVNTSGHDEERMTALAVRNEKLLDKCHECLEKTEKHLIISISNKTYLRLPTQRSLCTGHCQIVPIHHTASSTSCDEEVFSEIRRYVQSLVRMFSQDEEQGVIVVETCMKLNKQPHMVIECIPVPREIDEMAPIYFKKAIQECESEWAQNKKLVTLTKDKNIRQSIPRGFPFFSVDFGLDPGFAHVIEDEHTFPHYFGKEVVGGMLDIEPKLWRKPQKTSFDEQRLKVLNFSKQYKQYDWTITQSEPTNHDTETQKSANQELDNKEPSDHVSSSSE